MSLPIDWTDDSGIAVREDRRDLRGDGGYVLALTGLLMLPLLAFTAFAIDLGAWYAQASRIQRAADASALAGVVWATDSTKWDTVARDTAAKNGFTTSNSTITVTRDSDSQISVSIKAKGMQFFSKMFINNLDLTRRATAEYVVPVPMGSPTNRLGNDPDSTVTSPQMWLNVAGRATNKVSGDRNSAGVCDNGMYGCSGTTNTDYLPDGYFYKVAVGQKQASRSLAIDVFDPAFVYTGDLCEASTLPTTGNNDRYKRNTANPAGSWAGLKYCSGDQNLNGANIVTTYIVRAPDSTPLDNTDNPAVCAISFDPYNQDLSSLISNNQNRGRENVPFPSHFHTWFRLCTIPANQVVTGDYFVQVRTNADLSSPGSSPRTTANGTMNIGSLGNAATPNTGGHNRFALRSGWTTSASIDNNMAGTGLGFSADGRLPIYVNVSANTEFYLARITPDYAGKTLQLNFWDIGDISGGDADVTVKAPSDATNKPTSCTFKRDGASMPGTVSVSGCTVTGMTNSSFNGTLTQVTMPIPANYTCSSSSSTGCWFKIAIASSGTPTDTTTWSANVIGDPVHLIK